MVASLDEPRGGLRKMPLVHLSKVGKSINFPQSDPPGVEFNGDSKKRNRMNVAASVRDISLFNHIGIH